MGRNIVTPKLSVHNVNTNRGYARGLSVETPIKEVPGKLNASMMNRAVKIMVDPKKKSNFHNRPRAPKKKTLGESNKSH